MAAPGSGRSWSTPASGPGARPELTPMAELAGARAAVRRARWCGWRRLAEEVLASGTDDFAGEVEARLRSGPARRVPSGRRASRRTASGSTCTPTKPTGRRAPAAPSRRTTRAGWPTGRSAAGSRTRRVEIGLPLQFHVGYGDSDLDLLDCDPLRLTLVPPHRPRSYGVPVLLLHNWPFHRTRGVPRPGLRPRLHGPRPDHPQHRGALDRGAARDARARALRQAAVLLRRLRPGRAVPAGRPAVPPVDVDRAGRAGRRRRGDARRRGVRRRAGGARERAAGLRACDRGRDRRRDLGGR